MSFASRLTSVLRTAARSPAVRRGARGLGRAAVRAVRERQGGSGSSTPSRAGGASHRSADPAGVEGAGALADRAASPALNLTYAPHADDRPDPGEIVWAWVPYEEDITQGKDRPVLVVAQEDAATAGGDGSGDVLVALMLTSRDRADSAEVITDEHGSTWVDIGSGNWDQQGRPSEVRADRLLRIDPGSVRREGGRLGQGPFERVAAAVRTVHGWRD
ncbi:type II toxin-antitoxin system PemK/MazF family toxin [Brachybacterium sp. FME24]|uniref:type II toxin-antitoxin system PemK/MazF family toxin n=1 Tax=Brachybacterium sp. FME24 TaxID=2742605 RepID=UPI0018667305|nr:type II toxin-antitoxin system PemK/MazF family toxin [Brachybacterium sp. FME24]